MLRYIEIGLFGAFLLVFLNGVLDTSLESGNPIFFAVIVLSSFVVGWLLLPKFIEYVKTRWKH